MSVSLTQAKRHLRIDHDDDDDVIQFYLDTAVEWSLKYCNRDAVPTGAEFAFDAAALLVMADLYENREAQTATSLSENPAARRLIDPHRLMRV